MNLKHPSAAWKSSLVTAAGILAFTVTWAAPSDSPRAAAQTRAACISTPYEYLTAWNNRQVRCVSPSLFGTTYARGSTTIYPSGFWYAWAGSNTNLERYLLLRRLYGDDPPKVGIGILSYVGFPGLESYDTPTDLAVYTLPQGTQVQVPGFETWFRILDEEFGDTGETGRDRARWPRGFNPRAAEGARLLVGRRGRAEQASRGRAGPASRGRAEVLPALAASAKSAGRFGTTAKMARAMSIWKAPMPGPILRRILPKGHRWSLSRRRIHTAARAHSRSSSTGPPTTMAAHLVSTSPNTTKRMPTTCTPRPTSRSGSAPSPATRPTWSSG